MIGLCLVEIVIHHEIVSHMLECRNQTFGTIVGEPASVRKGSPSIGTPNSPFPFRQILLVAAYISPTQDHAKMPSWHPIVRLQDPFWLLCSPLFEWTSSLLPGQIFFRNLHPSFVWGPSQQCVLCIWVDSHFLLVSIYIPTYFRVSSFLWQLRQLICVVLIQGIHLFLHGTQPLTTVGVPLCFLEAFRPPLIGSQYTFLISKSF